MAVKNSWGVPAETAIGKAANTHGMALIVRLDAGSLTGSPCPRRTIETWSSLGRTHVSPRGAPERRGGLGSTATSLAWVSSWAARPRLFRRRRTGPPARLGRTVRPRQSARFGAISAREPPFPPAMAGMRIFGWRVSHAGHEEGAPVEVYPSPRRLHVLRKTQPVRPRASATGERRSAAYAPSLVSADRSCSARKARAQTVLVAVSSSSVGR